MKSFLVYVDRERLNLAVMSITDERLAKGLIEFLKDEYPEFTVRVKESNHDGFDHQ